MRILLFILFALTISVFGQIFTESFNNFYPDTTGKTVKAMFKFTNANAETDLTGTQNLTANGFSASYTNELVSISALENGSKALSFNGSTEYFSIVDANNDHFQITDGQDYTIAWMVYYNGVYTGAIHGLGNNFYLRLTNSANNDEGIYIRAYDGTDVYAAGQNSEQLNVGWNTIIWQWDDDVQAQVYVNGSSIGLGVGNFADINTVGTAVTFYIGRIEAAGFEFADTLAYYEFANSAYSTQQIKEWGFLANGWKSNSGGVTRNNFAFSQGVISDTVYYNTALTVGIWRVQIDVVGNSGGETYRILTSSDASTWTDLGSGTAGASSTTEIFSGAGTGYIGLAVSSAADTVFFDNLTVSIPASEIGYSKYRKNNKYPGW